MSELFVYPLSGLFNECHDIDAEALLRASPPDFSDDPRRLRGLNNFWWSEVLGQATIRKVTSALSEDPGPRHVPAHRAIVAAPDEFARQVRRAALDLNDLGSGPRAMFRSLETLQLYCDLYSRYVLGTSSLSLQNGIVLNDISSLEIRRNALSKSMNPYLEFLELYAFPVVEADAPELVWLVGPPQTGAMAIALHAKRVNPQCKVVSIGHSSEYYSLNKISKYLLKNEVFFSMVDVLVLDDFENTMPPLREALGRPGGDVSGIPNIMYRSETLEIVQNPYETARQSSSFHTHSRPTSEYDLNASVSAGEVAEVRLWPNSKCYWNNCNFCAINKRYQTLPRNDFSGATEVAREFGNLEAAGKAFLWSVDEAVPPRNLGALAEALVGTGTKILWETRSKIDRNFSDEICQLLGAAGLREIRLGLESGHPRVLRSMGKFPEGWSQDLVETVVDRFHKAGVSVHFPTIVGFPTETQQERQETYSLLERLRSKYPSVTFNVNVLGFDVGSKLFEEYPEFGITEIRWPVASKYFLGNLLEWNCAEEPFNYDQLTAERNDFMRRELYPWMPVSASLEPYLFYRLSETSRATLVWKAKSWDGDSWVGFPEGDFTSLIAPGPIIVRGPFKHSEYDPTDRFEIYDWSSHSSFECDQSTVDLIRNLAVPTDKESLDQAPGRDEELTVLIEMGLVQNASEGVSQTLIEALSKDLQPEVASKAAGSSVAGVRPSPVQIGKKMVS
jgi:radical SAM superfamily enzyme YgiQ (UPF0313 family)